MDVKAYRQQLNLNTRDVVRTMKERYPAYGRPIQSAVENPDRYGVMLIPEAEAWLTEALGAPATEVQEVPVPCEGEKCRKKDAHKLKGKLSCRTTITLQRRFGRAIRALGYKSVQDALTVIITEWLKQHEEEVKT